MSNREEKKDGSDEEPFVYRPPTIEAGEDQGYKPLFKQEVMRAAGPMDSDFGLSSHELQPEGLQWGGYYDSGPAALDFGEGTLAKGGAAGEGTLGFESDLVKKPVLVVSSQREMALEPGYPPPHTHAPPPSC